MNTDHLTVYQIRIKGHLGHQWMGWFEGLTITLEENGDTLLTGTLVDQAALHGILKKVRDLGVTLLSVYSVEPGREVYLREAMDGDQNDTKCEPKVGIKRA